MGSTTEDYDLVGSYNNQRFSPMDSERSVNLFQYNDVKSKKPKMLLPTSGLNNTGISFGATNNGFRASFLFKNNTYHVIGDSVWLVEKIGNALVPALLNVSLPFTTSTGYVGIDANTFQILFVDGVHGYIYDVNVGTFSQITDTSFPAQPIDCCYLDGFFVVANGNTNTFQLSQFNQGMVWGPATNTFSASATTDLLTLANTANYATGVSVIFKEPTDIDTFTGAAATNLLTIADGVTNYGVGVPVRVSTSGGGTLPDPLAEGTTYYCIADGPTTIKLATSYANAISNTPIDLISDSTQTCSIQGQLADPLNTSTTYYVINESATTLKVATSFANAQAGTAIDLLSNGGPNEIIQSTGQLQQASITTHPGTIVACRTLHEKLFLFSQFYTEIWENQGTGTNLPFRRNNSLLIEYGTVAPGSIATGFDAMFFLSQSRDGQGPVMAVVGTQAQPVSTNALDAQLAKYAAEGKITDCRSFLLKENGLIFYRMNFTLASHTFVYNATQSDASQDATRLWHEEEMLDGTRHVSQTHVFYQGLNLVGNYQSPILYIVDPNLPENDGEDIRRMRIGRPFCPPGYQRIRVDRFQIDLLQGQNRNLTFDNLPLLTENNDDILAENGSEIVTDQTLPIYRDVSPRVFLSISKDGGQTYGNLITAPMGKVGQRTYRTLWRKLGTTVRGQAFVPKIEFFNPLSFVLLGASWSYEVLPE